MADTYIKGWLKKTSGGSTQYRLPHTSLDGIVQDATVSGSTTFVTSGGKLLAPYMDTEASISGATTSARLAKPPTTEAVKDYVDSHAGGNLTAVTKPDFLENYPIDVSYSYEGGGTSNYKYTNISGGVTGHTYTNDDHGLGGWLIGSVQVSNCGGFSTLSVHVGEGSGSDSSEWIIRCGLNDGFTTSIPVCFPIPPNARFKIDVHNGFGEAVYDGTHTLYYIPNNGYAIPGSTIGNAVYSN